MWWVFGVSGWGILGSGTSQRMQAGTAYYVAPEAGSQVGLLFRLELPCLAAASPSCAPSVLIRTGSEGHSRKQCRLSWEAGRGPQRRLRRKVPRPQTGLDVHSQDVTCPVLSDTPKMLASWRSWTTNLLRLLNFEAHQLQQYCTTVSSPCRFVLRFKAGFSIDCVLQGCRAPASAVFPYGPTKFPQCCCCCCCRPVLCAVLHTARRKSPARLLQQLTAVAVVNSPSALCCFCTKPGETLKHEYCGSCPLLLS